jgi:SpoVK/Ycf46/Vps4 family AAA+-type ATPase
MTVSEPITFSPDLTTDDDHAIYWLRQVTIRLRREICWCWHERGITQDSNLSVSTILPPFVDKTGITLNLSRYCEQKIKFFKTDKTAAYLTEQLETILQPKNKDPPRGSFSWLVDMLNLDDISSFVLALGLIVSFDSAVGSIISACLNDPQKAYPNLALAQKIWNRPEEIMRVASPDNILFRVGLLQHYDNIKNASGINWESPLGVPSLVASQLLFPNSPLPALFEPISEQDSVVTDTTSLIAAKLRSQNDTMRIIPIHGQKKSDHIGVVGGIAKNANRKVVEFKGDPRLLQDHEYLNSIAALCWLKGLDLYLGKEQVSFLTGNNHGTENHMLPLQSIPVTIFLAITEKNQLENIPDNILLTVVDVPNLSYHERLEHWKKALGEKSSGLEDVIVESSRRFRYEKESINRICEGLKNITSITKSDFITACRAELKLDLGDLAQHVTPRFKDEMLILPHKQQLQFQEIIQAMKSLTRVHYDWQMAKTWNEGGISVLFAGPSGTGKTMAAEILAHELDLPIYRIDLSQVVNKYVGETEKNLKRVFDTADASDIVLFFDEADALFGRRTEVKDAHDRFANLEINYLLERMERFKGLSILATNRKKDLDEAFMRRIRYVMDFPTPSEEQRKMIWLQAIPKSVDASGIDFDFLARQFQLTGGHIKSIVLNACLQSAKSSSSTSKIKDELTMEKIVIAIKREYEKSGRSVSTGQFGKYGEIIKRMEGV